MHELHFCGDFNSQINAAEKRLIPHIKRFFECVVGDPEFYVALQENAAGCEALLRARGIAGVEPEQLAVLFPELFMLKEVSTAELADKPQALLWRRYCEAAAGVRELLRQRGGESPSHRFNAWRQRQVNRCQSQLGQETNAAIVHATAAFELSKGCSMGCSFCGLAAEPLQAVFMYTDENARLWQTVLDVVAARLGTTVGIGLCYWATEPSDNSDYFKFLGDYWKKTGSCPQTTTAAPLRKLDWTRELLRFRREHVTSADRFSIHSTELLRRVHQEFSAEDLALTELILQHSDTWSRLMARSGRNRRAVPADSQAKFVTTHTICCLSGYLINMVERSVRLISPCPPSERWPLGYRVHSEGSFATAAELDGFIVKTIETCMPEHMTPADTLAFRQDLVLTSLPEGFELHSAYRLHKLTGAPQLVQLGRFIAQGNLTVGDVLEEIAAQRQDVLAVASSIHRLFEQGLLEENLL
ncbi:conserved hypothetical protein [uncultured Sporomusa sp.]|uniref:Radical SAM family RiPP maturation amino acid epimerase n=1 Tax=uncultured Sporomusa sp. TaxID=307249 RepID=A0A212LN27_9FIRM|nr:radical SAM family RiPP maturation amino acid epimerase [uncultured Sporomusa sp.]SCM78910.1 conserved hypothetical protein [uncultured Sporomusa sp.]